MPTQIPPGEKAAFLDIINIRNSNEVSTIDAFLVNYEDILLAINYLLIPFSSYPNYLKESLLVFTDSELVNVGILVDKDEVALVTNPVLLLNTTTTAGILIDTNQDTLYIFGDSNVDVLNIDSLIHLKSLLITSGAIVNLADASLQDSTINLINIKTYRNLGGNLNLIINNSGIGQVNVDEGSFFGGYGEINPALPCALPVTNLTATGMTPTSITIGWTLPTPYLFVNVYYRLFNDGNYLEPTSGIWSKDEGFTFTNLIPNTKYDFKVTITCKNGGTSDSTYLTESTTN